MKSQLLELKSADLKPFLLSNKICVLRAQVGSSSEFNKFLQIQLEGHFKESLSLAWIDTKKIGYRSSAIQEFIKVSIPKIGLRASNTVFPVYHLFKEGELIAYHPGTIALDK